MRDAHGALAHEVTREAELRAFRKRRTGACEVENAGKAESRLALVSGVLGIAVSALGCGYACAASNCDPCTSDECTAIGALPSDLFNAASLGLQSVSGGGRPPRDWSRTPLFLPLPCRCADHGREGVSDRLRERTSGAALLSFPLVGPRLRDPASKRAGVCSEPSW